MKHAEFYKTEFRNIKEVAAFLSISRQAVYRLRDEGKLTFVYVLPRSPRIRTEEVRSYLQEMQEAHHEF